MVGLLEVDGGTLAAFVVLVLAVVIVIVFGVRLLVRDPRVRVARFGVFIERERVDDLEGGGQELEPTVEQPAIDRVEWPDDS